MKLSKKKLIVIVSVLILILLLLLFSFQSPSDKVAKILRKNGYTNEKGSSLYSKQISTLNLSQFNQKIKSGDSAVYEENYFDTKQYQFIKNKMEYSDNIRTNFTPKYDYVTGYLTYTYRVIINENSNVIFEGNYNPDTDSISCENTYNHDFYLEGNEDIFCKKIEQNVKDFYLEMTSVIKNVNLIHQMMKENDGEKGD